MERGSRKVRVGRDFRPIGPGMGRVDGKKDAARAIDRSLSRRAAGGKGHS